MDCLNLSADAVSDLEDLRCLEVEPQGGDPVHSRFLKMT